ncbi:hypothetical protein GYM54_01360 [Pseudomonas sp. MTM4]|uniref:hypothetical protein n=1 Tax=unclassified Pseudomonas TaxID=196821 RepID=UPI0018D23FE6|nr:MULTISPECIES: hypothetical protein [unclassified Pseudomonas]MBC8648386.1 hypothetical protein [Pseudomonas sp. MT4]QXY90331.1 hypothetical protein GYM54_01360 [Pseudomonas sp. MTM4]
MANEESGTPALATVECVREFSASLLQAADAYQRALHRISIDDLAFADSGYTVLTEVYGLRNRAYVLQNDAANHIVANLSFTQRDLMDLISRAAKAVNDAVSLKRLQSIVLSIATLTVSLGDDRAKVVEFLYESLRSDILDLEAE